MKAPLTAEPCCVSSGSRPVRHPVTPTFGPCGSLPLPQHPAGHVAARRGHTLQPPPSLPRGFRLKQPRDTASRPRRGTGRLLPRPWERGRESSVLPNLGGKVCSRFCLFPLSIRRVIFTPGRSHGAIPAAAADLPCRHAGFQSQLLPRGSQLPSPLPPRLPALEKPARLLTRTWGAGVLPGGLVAWLGPRAWAWGGRAWLRGAFLPAWVLPGQGTSVVSPSFPHGSAGTPLKCGFWRGVWGEVVSLVECWWASGPLPPAVGVGRGKRWAHRLPAPPSRCKTRGLWL